MSYYQRPMGDYKTYGYAGDPGFLSSLWKGVKAVGKAVLGIPPKPAAMPSPPGWPVVAAGGAAGYGLQQWAGPASPRQTLPVSGAAGPAMGAGGFQYPTECCPSGYHLDKRTRTRCVRNRRMNVANPKALRKALRRTDGFVKLAKRSLKGTGYAVRRA